MISLSKVVVNSTMNKSLKKGIDEMRCVLVLLYACVFPYAQNEPTFENIFSKCWDNEKQVFDFTLSQWQQLSYKKQIKFSKKYQSWYAQKKAIKTHKTIKVLGASIEVMLAPPGRFFSHNYDKEKGFYKKKYTIDKAFWIGIHEVTQMQWRTIMKENPSFFQKGENYPVENVSWEDCKIFCKKINAFLPNEKQWEYACRGGTTRNYNTLPYDKIINYNPYSPSLKHEKFLNSTLEVGVLPNQNAWGGFDFHGNLFEWCENSYKYNKNKRVVAGGAYLSSIQQCSSNSKFHFHHNLGARYIGFRVCFILKCAS